MPLKIFWEGIEDWRFKSEDLRETKLDGFADDKIVENF